MKKCLKCNKTKPLNSYYKHPGNSDGRLNKCKECKKELQRKNYRKNIEHYREYDRDRNRNDFKRMWLNRYGHMKESVEGRNHHKRSVEGEKICSKKDFLDWCMDTKDRFQTLYDDWKDSGFEAKLTPSIDRVDNSKSYTIDNMQWLTLSENASKDNQGAKITKRNKLGQIVKAERF